MRHKRGWMDPESTYDVTLIRRTGTSWVKLRKETRAPQSVAEDLWDEDMLAIKVLTTSADPYTYTHTFEMASHGIVRTHFVEKKRKGHIEYE